MTKIKRREGEFGASASILQVAYIACYIYPSLQVLEYLRHFIPAESVLIGHEISAIVDAFGLVKGEDYAALIETSDWFAVQLSTTLCQRFTLAHILQVEAK